MDANRKARIGIPRQSFHPAVERPEPFSEGGQDDRVREMLTKTKQARNFKDLKGLKCNYTFRTGASFRMPVVGDGL